MRIVVTLATLLALLSGVSAASVLGGDDGLGDGAIVQVASADAGSDTSVYHLEHTHAGQTIGRVKSLIAQIAAYAADDDMASLPGSLVLLPTTSDDAIIAICPRAHAGLVRHAIKSCDTLKQYAVKVQIFEVADSGKTIPVGGPHLLIGREGTAQCATPEESVSINFKVETPLVDANTEVAPAPSDAEEAGVAGTEAAACAAAGHCHMDCTPPIGEMSVEAASEPSGVVHYDSETGAVLYDYSGTGEASSCCASGTCAGCKTGTCTGDCCQDGCCHGQSASCSTSGCKCDGTCCTAGETSVACSGTCAACKTGTCTGECCKDGCCHGQSASGTCSTSSCKCDGSCSASGNSTVSGNVTVFGTCTGAGCTAPQSQRIRSYEEMTTESPSSSCSKRFSVGFGFGTGCPGLHFVSPIVWFNKGNEPRCAACKSENQIADSDDGHNDDAFPAVPPAPADPVPNVHFFTTQSGGIFFSTSGVVKTPAPGVQVNPGHFVLNADGGPTIIFRAPAQCSQGVCWQAAGEQTGSSCTDGAPALVAGQESAASPNAPCCCEETEDERVPGAEPPALLTLSQHKESTTGFAPAPHWQEELLRLRGLGLSQLFESHSAPAPEGAELGRLIAEFPKHPSTSTGHVASHTLTVVDSPDRVRIFESTPTVSSETVKIPVPNTCPNCREQFGAFLEEMFRRPEASEEISQTAHHEGDQKSAEAVRDLPNVTLSKIATETHSYPLRDLVLCDDAGRPVFDTCTIIDHLQAAVAPESWSHPSVSIQLDQQTVSLVVTQTAKVHEQIAVHLHYLRRLQVKQLCNLIERLSGDPSEEAPPVAPRDPVAPTSDVELGPALPIGSK